MRRVLSLVAALVMCVALVAPAAVSADTFVPSISYKDGPEVESAELNGENVEMCIIVTSILGAKEKTTDIHQDDRDLLLEVYEKLSDGSMKLPLEDYYVIRELLDVNFKQSVCVVPGHTHEEDLAKQGITIKIDFDLGVKATTNVKVLSYHDGQWAPIKSVVNNGDGTVTCEFEHFCPVAFCVEEGAEDGPSQTGDPLGNMFYVWIALLAVAMIALVALLAHMMRRKKK